MSKAKVSVAMCTYNAGAYLEQQLASIFGQSRPPDELVICDDGSKDKTIEIIERMAQDRPTQVRLIHNQKNLGCVKNFEKSVSLTTGDIIFLSDFDDYWFPDRIATMLEPFHSDPGVVVTYCDAELTDGELSPAGETVFGRRPWMHLSQSPTLHQFGRGIGFNGVMMAFRSNLKELIIPFSTDWEHDHWISFIALAVGNIKPIPKTLLYYRRHGKNRGLDPDLDGGKLYRYQQAARRSMLKQYAQRRRRWEDMVSRLRSISSNDSGLGRSARFRRSLEEAELCLQFARKREHMKTTNRVLRLKPALGSLLTGEYHRHAHGVKSLIQDVAIR